MFVTRWFHVVAVIFGLATGAALTPALPLSLVAVQPRFNRVRRAPSKVNRVKQGEPALWST